MPTSLADKITDVAPEILGERREVTVVFVDVNNFTANAHEMDSEDAFLLIDEAMRLLAEVVYEYEGTIDKFTGDGLLALFGAPVAHENSPERAVRAALKMQAVLQPLKERVKEMYGFDFEVRIGINTGLVVAGKLGSDLHMEYTVVGDTVNLANRLQTAAEPGTILVSFATYQRTRPLFEFREVPPLSVKGIPDPVRAFCPLGLRAIPGRVRGLPGLQVPMVGRQDALRRMRDALSKVRQRGERQIVLVTGEAGIGKSRLVTEFREAAIGSDVNIYQGGCLSYARSKPLWVVAEVLRDILGLSEIDPVGPQLKTLQNYLNQRDLNTEDLLPYLVHLLGLSQTDSQTEARLRLLDAAMLQRQTHAALRQILLAEARRAPTVLVFEDLHWVDPASKDFLEYLIQTTGGQRLMLILVSRNAKRQMLLRPLIPLAEKQPEGLVDIQLQELSEAEAQSLIDQLIKAIDDETQAVKQLIAERAGGIPFYVEEIVRMLIDEGGLMHQDGTWRLMPWIDELLEEVPGTLNGLILTRFDRLPASTRKTLQKAAVLGRAFPLGLVQSLNGANRGAIATQLDELASRQFLVPVSFGAEPGYAFQHTLIQEAIYATLLKRDRRRLHKKAGQAIERVAFWTREEQVELLAHHYAESSTPSKAIPFLHSAARNADRRCANEATIDHCRRALKLMPDQPTGQIDAYFHVRILLARALKFVGELGEANRILTTTLGQFPRADLGVESTSVVCYRVDALRELADVRQREGAYDEAIAHLQEALDALGAERAQESPGQWRALMDRMAWIRFRQGKLEEAFALASSATIGVDPEHTDDPATLAGLYNTLGGIAWHQGNLSEAIAYVERSIHLYTQIGYTWGTAVAQINLGVLQVSRGSWSKALANYEQTYRLLQEVGDVQNLALNLANLGDLRMLLGDHVAARRDLEASLSIREQLGDAWGTAHAHTSLAHLAVIQSRFEDATSHLSVALALLDGIESQETEVYARWLLALVQAATGDLRTGLASAEQALRMARSAGLAESEADCRRVLGVLRARTGEYWEAENLLRESAHLCLHRNDPYRQALALLELGRVRQHLARADYPQSVEWRAKAEAALKEATEKFKSLGAAYDLGRAQSALSQFQVDGAAGSSAGLPDAEWHTASVVWLGLRPARGSDDETVLETILTAQPALTAIVREHGGQVILRHDGLTAVFGVPATYENHSERAVQAAWAVREYLAQFSDEAALPLTTRLAVTQGTVVAGHAGHKSQLELVVTGEPMQEAQEIAGTAPPDRVWVSQAVGDATDHLFVYAPVSSDISARLTDSQVSQLLGVRQQPAGIASLPRLRARLVGRDGPLDAMIRLAQNLNGDTGGLIWIEGEAGIGKSRLMYEFATLMESTAALVVSGKCTPQASGLAFSLFSSLLRRIFDIRATDISDQTDTKLDETIQDWPTEARATRPYLEMLLGVRPTGLEGARLTNLEPDQLRQQIFVAVRRLLTSLATEQPLVMLLDDLHWIDPMSAELLLFVSSVVTSAPVLLVCAQRPEDGDDRGNRLLKTKDLHPDHTVWLRLDRLSMAESETLVSELIPEAELPAALIGAILERSDGNPYFIEEFVRMLIEQDYVCNHEGRWEVGPDVNTQNLPLPASLEALIRSRIDGLPGRQKGLLQCAAVIGGSFGVDLLEVVGEQSVSGADLAQLESRGMLSRTAYADQWQFNHSLTQAVVYNALLRARRKILHLRAGLALETHWVGAEKEHAEELAYHFSRAGEDTKALHYLVLSGERAAARYANEEAKAYFKEAARLLTTQPDAGVSLRWRITAGLGDVHQFVGEYAESTAVLETGLPLVHSEELDDDRRAGIHRRLGETAQKQGELETAHEHFITALAVLGRPVDRYAQREAARIMTSLAWNHFLQGQFNEAREACGRGLEYARGTGSLSLNEMASAENLLGGICYQLGEWKAAYNHTSEAMALRERMGYTWGVAATLSNLGVLAISAGDWDKAKQYFQESLKLRQEIGDMEGVAIVHNNLGSLTRDQGGLDDAEFHFRESLAVSKPLDIAYHVVNATSGLAQVLMLKGETGAADETIAASVAQAEAIGAQDLLAETSRVQAEIRLAQSAWDEANRVARESAALAAETGNRGLVASAWRVVCEAELERGDVLAAGDALARARLAMTDVTDELESARVASQASRLSLREGDFAQAEQHLQAAREIFTRLGATLDLQHAENAFKESEVHYNGSFS